MKFYQRIAAFLAAAMLAVATCAIPAHADTADDLAAAQARLEELGAQLNSLQTTLAEQGAQLEDTQYQIDQKQGEIDQTTADLAEARAVLSDRLRSDYKVGAVTFLDVLLQATDFSDLVSRIHYMDSIAKADADAISAVRDLEAQLADQMEELEAREVPEELEVRRGVANRLTKTHHIRTDTGIDITFPAELPGRPGYIEFDRDAEGRLVITMRHIARIENR